MAGNIGEGETNPEQEIERKRILSLVDKFWGVGVLLLHSCLDPLKTRKTPLVSVHLSPKGFVKFQEGEPWCCQLGDHDKTVHTREVKSVAGVTPQLLLSSVDQTFIFFFQTAYFAEFCVHLSCNRRCASSVRWLSSRNEFLWLPVFFLMTACPGVTLLYLITLYLHLRALHLTRYFDGLRPLIKQCDVSSRARVISPTVWSLPWRTVLERSIW